VIVFLAAALVENVPLLAGLGRACGVFYSPFCGVMARRFPLKTYSKKICLLGDFSVGKTSLVRRFVHNRFDDQYISTIGVKVSRKTVVLSLAEELVELTLMVWDLAGGQGAGTAAASYLRGAVGAVLVCDMTRAESLAHLPLYARDLHNVMPSAKLMVAANKFDLTNDYQLDADNVAATAAQLGAPYYLTSAKEGNEVETLFRHFGKLLLGVA